MVTITYIESEWDKEIILGDKILAYLKENNTKTVALFASVQFLKLDTVKKQLKEAGIEIKITKAKRTHVSTQVLGCDAYHDSFEDDIIQDCDTILYVGDGMFHPKALLLAQRTSKEIKPVLIWDPVNENMKQITEKDISAQLKKAKANLIQYLAANTIGIIVTTKPGQQFLKYAKKLKQQLEEKEKKAYIFIADTIDYAHLENYPFIEVWVNTACPRVGMDDITTIPHPLINMMEAMEPEKALESLS